MKKLLVLTLFTGLVVAAITQGQVPPAIRVAPPILVKGGDGPVEVIVGPNGEVIAAGPPGSPGNAEAGSKLPNETPRLTKIKQIQFDRRPSAILKAWAPKPKADPDKPAPKKDPKDEALENELNELQKNVSTGQWDKVKSYLASLPDEEAIAGYKQILQTLQRSPGAMPMMPGGGEMSPEEMQMMMMRQTPAAQQFAERHAFTMTDLFGIASAVPTTTNAKLFPVRSVLAGPGPVLHQAPKGMQDKEHLPIYSTILREVIAGGTLPEVAVAQLKTETAKPAGQSVFTKRQIAKLLVNSGHAQYASDFLPTFEEAQTQKDLEALNLLSRHFLTLMSAPDQKAGNLERAWNAVQAVLAFPDGSQEQKQEALLRAVELAPRITEKLGQQWLDESFTKKPERGMEIIATVGTLVTQGLPTRPFQPDERLNALKLMKTAVEALLKAAPDKAKQWKPTLTVLAVAWLKEAEFSQQNDQSSGSGPRLRRDGFGNIYYSGDEDGMMPHRMMMNPNMPRPIVVADVLRARPGDEWVASVDDGFRPKLADVLARLHLKLNEEEKAFPLIEQIATAQPDEAKGLVREFLRIWTNNHDPNSNRNQYRYSWFFYGFENRAESIPLTRSKQERNLTELSGWVARIKKLPGRAGELDDEQIVRAFTTCHSSAEVYKTEAIERVFGPLGSLKPRTLAGLAQQMRGNLAGLWRLPSEQEKNKTKRKKKDIEAEVLRGYEVARQTIDDGLKKFPDHWALLTAKASVQHDEINYRQELSKNADFSAKRGDCFELYQKAAHEYAKVVKSITETEQTNLVFEQWFYASLGAADLGAITEEKQPAPKEAAKIQKAILALPGELAQKHMDRFANELFTRMSGAKPQVKFSYLKAGFEIVGENPRAVEAKKVFDYYKDLVREIKLEAKTDGSTSVGHGRSFGVFINLVHTRDIERESNGFSRYLQNQNSAGYYFYNYGRPTADYRDRFEQAAREALKEHFEIQSITFQDEKVNSRALPEFGWRFTPYAYLLLKPRGPQVDALPSMRIDLDFLDTSGYVVLPIESPKVPIDCRTEKPEPRPITNLTVTQTLDERQADKGVLLLEIKAVGVGLVPDLESLCKTNFPGFETTKTEDQGLAVKKFEEDLERNAIVSERTWTLTLQGQSGQTELPKSFQFASVQVPTKEKDGLLYQRYSDADLVAVEQNVSLERKYGSKGNRWMWFLAAGLVVVTGLVITLVVMATRRRKPIVTTLSLPEDLNAFTVLQLLEKLRDNHQLSSQQREELNRAIDTVEQYYFSADRNGDSAPDLRGIAVRWVSVSSGV